MTAYYRRNGQWIPIAEGKEGKQGDVGPRGPQGIQGLKGDQGERGPAGEQGIQGPQGLTGPAGPTGPQGGVGPKGDKGDQGEPFRIAKIYKSIAEMNAGYSSDGVPIGGFVIIETDDVDNPDNSKLFVKGSSAYTFVTDLSGAQGVQGPPGEKGDTGSVGPQGPAGPTGAKGEQGIQGVQGPPGEKGATGEVDYSRLADYLPLAGGTMTGDLTVGQAKVGTNGYVEGTWLKTTGATDLGSSEKIAVVNPQGWIYYRSKTGVISDLGIDLKADSTTVTELDERIKALENIPNANGVSY